jgi:hypothetical protein
MDASRDAGRRDLYPVPFSHRSRSRSGNFSIAQRRIVRDMSGY